MADLQKHTSVRQKITKNMHEKQAWQENIMLCGVDEVGRGCLAGPVVAAAVILPPFKVPRILKDSKLLDQKELQEGHLWIISNCTFSVAIIEARAIDQHNIYQATMHAMKRAVTQLLYQKPTLKIALVDAMPLLMQDLHVVAAPYGEQWSSSIAAASILAKVTRDSIMHQVDTLVPGYTFANHKGYCTQEHQKNLAATGYSIVHRTTFLKKFISRKTHDKQQTLW